MLYKVASCRAAPCHGFHMPNHLIGTAVIDWVIPCRFSLSYLVIPCQDFDLLGSFGKIFSQLLTYWDHCNKLFRILVLLAPLRRSFQNLGVPPLNLLGPCHPGLWECLACILLFHQYLPKSTLQIGQTSEEVPKCQCLSLGG